MGGSLVGGRQHLERLDFDSVRGVAVFHPLLAAECCEQARQPGQEMLALFPEHPETLANTQAVADRCEFEADGGALAGAGASPRRDETSVRTTR